MNNALKACALLVGLSLTGCTSDVVTVREFTELQVVPPAYETMCDQTQEGVRISVVGVRSDTRTTCSIDFVMYGNKSAIADCRQMFDHTNLNQKDISLTDQRGPVQVRRAYQQMETRPFGSPVMSVYPADLSSRALPANSVVVAVPFKCDRPLDGDIVYVQLKPAMAANVTLSNRVAIDGARQAIAVQPLSLKSASR